MQKYFATIAFLCFVLVIATFYAVFYTPWLAVAYLPDFVGRYGEGWQLRSLQIGGQSFQFPEILKWSRLSGEIQKEDAVYRFDMAEAIPEEIFSLWKAKRQANVTFTGINISGRDVEIKQANMKVLLTASPSAELAMDVTGHAAGVFFRRYHFQNITARLKTDSKQCHISEMTTNLYGGRAQGEIQINFQNREVFASVEFSGIKSETMEEINKSFFSQLSAQFDGSLRLKMTGDWVEILALHTTMPKGSKLHFRMIKAMSAYLTQEESIQKIESIIERGIELPLDSADIHILNTSGNLAAVTFILRSKRYGLDIQETVNMDIQRIFQKVSFP